MRERRSLPVPLTLVTTSEVTTSAAFGCVTPHANQQETRLSSDTRLGRPNVLIVTSARERFIEIQRVDIGWAEDSISACVSAASNRVDAIVVDAVVGRHANESGYELVKKLRARCVPCPIFLIADQPLPSDRDVAMQSGATALLRRDCRAIERLLVESSSSTACGLPPVLAANEPIWLGELASRARLVLASDGETRTRSIYHGLRVKGGGRSVTCEEVANELAGLLKDSPRDQAAFIKLSRQLAVTMT